MSQGRREADRIQATTICNVAFGDKKKVDWRDFIATGRITRNEYYAPPATPGIIAAKKRLRAANEAARRRVASKRSKGNNGKPH